MGLFWKTMEVLLTESPFVISWASGEVSASEHRESVRENVRESERKERERERESCERGARRECDGGAGRGGKNSTFKYHRQRCLQPYEGHGTSLPYIYNFLGWQKGMGIACNPSEYGLRDAFQNG
jgi:hypothetical protein